ncbi:MAG: peptidoglycan editing factor PgeF [Acidobacteriota bacterium]
MSVLTSGLLEGLEWVHHGFGTRDANLTQDQMVSLQQVHSNIVRVADRRTGCVGEGDALVTSEADVPVSIRTADCLPILLADRRTCSVAAVHAGWRGTAAGIVGRTLERMHAEFGSRPEDMIAAIGPGIGHCCYEVGLDVARQFGLDRAGHIDLAAQNRAQLSKAGVPVENIDVLNMCTFCEAGRFFSYRREGDRAGRMISYIGSGESPTKTLRAR